MRARLSQNDELGVRMYRSVCNIISGDSDAISNVVNICSLSIHFACCSIMELYLTDAILRGVSLFAMMAFFYFLIGFGGRTYHREMKILFDKQEEVSVDSSETDGVKEAWRRVDRLVPFFACFAHQVRKYILLKHLRSLCLHAANIHFNSTLPNVRITSK